MMSNWVPDDFEDVLHATTHNCCWNLYLYGKGNSNEEYYLNSPNSVRRIWKLHISIHPDNYSSDIIELIKPHLLRAVKQGFIPSFKILALEGVPNTPEWVREKHLPIVIFLHNDFTVSQHVAGLPRLLHTIQALLIKQQIRRGDLRTYMTPADTLLDERGHFTFRQTEVKASPRINCNAMSPQSKQLGIEGRSSYYYRILSWELSMSLNLLMHSEKKDAPNKRVVDERSSSFKHEEKTANSAGKKSSPTPRFFLGPMNFVRITHVISSPTEDTRIVTHESKRYG